MRRAYDVTQSIRVELQGITQERDAWKTVGDKGRDETQRLTAVIQDLRDVNKSQDEAMQQTTVKLGIFESSVVSFEHVIENKDILIRTLEYKISQDTCPCELQRSQAELQRCQAEIATLESMKFQYDNERA